MKGGRGPLGDEAAVDVQFVIIICRDTDGGPFCFVQPEPVPEQNMQIRFHLWLELSGFQLAMPYFYGSGVRIFGQSDPFSLECHLDVSFTVIRTGMP